MTIATSIENAGYNSPDGIIVGASATGTPNVGKVGFYGTTPVVQRAAAIQAASVVSATSYISVTSNLAAFCAEVAATLTGMGIWKGVA